MESVKRPIVQREAPLCGFVSGDVVAVVVGERVARALEWRRL